eukprot:TRINITY_DN7523_c0_g1_i1.p1 TRINITY_DN7523_c0_g1~~TRINITY_DN7523_c0_g1_i1.p1  ORF type:complete len:267 (+),score=55.93 TRINITY_DN7523_c0_g1_i1:475-1275(+)
MGKMHKFLEKIKKYGEDVQFDIPLPSMLTPISVRCGVCDRAIKLSEEYKSQNFKLHLRRHFEQKATRAVVKTPLKRPADGASPPPLPFLSDPSTVELSKQDHPQDQQLTALPVGVRFGMHSNDMSTMHHDKRARTDHVDVEPSEPVEALPLSLQPFERLLRPLHQLLASGRLQPQHLFYQLMQSVVDASQYGPIAARWSHEYPQLNAFMQKYAEFYGSISLRHFSGGEPSIDSFDFDKQLLMIPPEYQPATMQPQAQSLSLLNDLA